MSPKRSESLSMIMHIGSFATKEVENDIRMTLRAAMSLERRQLKKARIRTREEGRMTVEGGGITVSMYGRGWIHLDTDVDPPLSTERLATASRYNNAVAYYFNNLFTGKTRIDITTTITQKVPSKAINLRKFCLEELLGKMSKVVGYDMVPRGLWFISREPGQRYSMIVTGYEKNYDVDFLYSIYKRDHIPKDILVETHKKLRGTIPKFLPILRAD